MGQSMFLPRITAATWDARRFGPLTLVAVCNCYMDCGILGARPLRRGERLGALTAVRGLGAAGVRGHVAAGMHRPDRPEGDSGRYH